MKYWVSNGIDIWKINILHYRTTPWLCTHPMHRPSPLLCTLIVPKTVIILHLTWHILWAATFPPKSSRRSAQRVPKTPSTPPISPPTPPTPPTPNPTPTSPTSPTPPTFRNVLSPYFFMRDTSSFPSASGTTSSHSAWHLYKDARKCYSVHIDHKDFVNLNGS